MDAGRGVKFLLFFTFGLHLAETRFLRVIYIGITPGTSCPEFIAVGRMNGEQYASYDSTSRKLTLTKWAEKITVAKNLDVMKKHTQMLQDDQEIFKADIVGLMRLFNQTGGIHTLQMMYDYDLNENTIGGFSKFGYDGEDFLSLDVQTLTWTAANDQAELTKQKWEAESRSALFKARLEAEYIPLLRKVVSYGREILERKDPPEASLFQKNSSSPELVCHATGFFPKDIMMSWKKNGEDVDEDVEVLETLPNNDGSFQKRIILRVSPEELQKYDYTCVIQHSSMKEDLVLKASERPILSGPGGGSIGIIVGVVVGLMALVLCAAGILIWKKKKSDFRPAPSRAGSEGDSGSTHS